MSEQRRQVFTEEFKREAVGLIASSGRTLRQVASDLGLGLSTLTRWKRQLKDVEIINTPYPDVTKELARLRQENEVLRQERDFLKILRWVQPVSARKMTWSCWPMCEASLLCRTEPMVLRVAMR